MPLFGSKDQRSILHLGSSAQRKIQADLTLANGAIASKPPGGIKGYGRALVRMKQPRTAVTRMTLTPQPSQKCTSIEVQITNRHGVTTDRSYKASLLTAANAEDTAKSIATFLNTVRQSGDLCQETLAEFFANNHKSVTFENVDDVINTRFDEE